MESTNRLCKGTIQNSRGEKCAACGLCAAAVEVEDRSQHHDKPAGRQSDTAERRLYQFYYHEITKRLGR